MVKYIIYYIVIFAFSGCFAHMDDSFNCKCDCEDSKFECTSVDSSVEIKKDLK